jgi:hypothetical protein
MAYSSITKPTDYFTTNLWTGAGATSKTISGNSFQPDWVWVKRRSATGSHKLYDAVRGTTKDLSSDNGNAETTASGSGYLNTFNSDGFTLVQGSSDNYYVDANGVTYVAWNWKANGAGSANSDGTITTTATSANTTSGFSIIKYTGNGTAGATIGHGLNSAPDLVIGKKLSASANWDVWGDLLGSTNMINFNTTAAKFNPNGNYHNDTMPTSTVVTLGNDNDINQNGEPYVMYCFHSVKGYSKIGSYTGNGNADGTFVYTGFRPAFILAKRTDAVDNWVMYDNRRSGYNPQNDRLYPNLSAAEEGTTDKMFDMLSNGFKARATWTTINASGGTYIYMAFAEHPLVANVNGGLPATAR